MLMTEPDAPIALQLQEMMLYGPKRPRSIYDEMQALLDAGKIQICPEVVAEWMKEFGVQTEERS